MSWFAVTVFFYCQHYIIVKKYLIDKEVVFNDVIIKIKEISIDNHRMSKKREEDMNAYRGPWYFKFARHLPGKLQMPFIQICYFYSRPYEFNDKFGTLRINGLVLPKNGDFNISNMLERIDFYVYDEDMKCYGNERGLRHNLLSNIYFLDVEGKNAPFGNKEFKVVVKDRRNNDIRELNLRPEWRTETYDYFDGLPKKSIEPKITIDRFISHMRQGKRKEAGKYVLPELMAKFPWERVDHQYWSMGGNDYLIYQGNYKGFDNVYSVHVNFGELESGELVVRAEQKIYFTDREGECHVIDADPLNVLTKPVIFKN